ncbi:MAG: lamin tail domain-containing protein [Algicola sp.]|nr:lamin tail domain-containing protein [Algicola sp.]
MKKMIFKIMGAGILMSFLCCVDGKEFDEIGGNCETDMVPNIAFAELDSLVQDEVIQIQEDLILEGYVISSDRAGNFFGVLYLQDALINPSMGIQLEMDLRESHLQFPVGSKVLIKLKGLYLDKRGDDIRIGSVFSSFGNLSIGRLPNGRVSDHFLISCEGGGVPDPVITTIPEMDSLPSNILVKLENVEFAEEALGKTYAIAQEETERTLMDCKENMIALVNSGYADFQSEPLPETNGTLTAILTKDGDAPQLIIRTLEDVNFTDERCPEIITEFTSTQIFISELADPINNSGARFVELYNSALEPLDLNLWTLRRYTNDNIEISSTIDLSNLIIGPKGTLVISPNIEEFELVYGFTPDLGVSTNSPADSNGDDNLELVDPFGNVIDVFGVIGEDGTGTDHEFKDGRAVRNLDIMEGNPIFTFGEWVIFNDSGEAGTINLPQNAPEDFTPGVRE